MCGGPGVPMTLGYSCEFLIAHRLSKTIFFVIHQYTQKLRIKSEKYNPQQPGTYTIPPNSLIHTFTQFLTKVTARPNKMQDRNRIIEPKSTFIVDDSTNPHCGTGSTVQHLVINIL